MLHDGDLPFPHQVLSLANFVDNPSETSLSTVDPLGSQKYFIQDGYGYGSDLG